MSGGFTESQLDTNVFRVTFKGNGYTSPDRAEDMALLRSAELALQHGFTAVMEQVRAMTETAADMTEAAEEPQSVSQDSPG